MCLIEHWTSDIGYIGYMKSKLLIKMWFQAKNSIFQAIVHTCFSLNRNNNNRMKIKTDGPTSTWVLSSIIINILKKTCINSETVTDCMHAMPYTTCSTLCKSNNDTRSSLRDTLHQLIRNNYFVLLIRQCRMPTENTHTKKVVSIGFGLGFGHQVKMNWNWNWNWKDKNFARF